MTAFKADFYNDITEEQVEEQEHLTPERLKNLTPKYPWRRTVKDGTFDYIRPREDLIDLMQWVKSSFATDLRVKDAESLCCYIHNKIVIDGSFLEFCEQHSIEVSCLYRDSVASWKSEHDFEHFMAQGVFKIKTVGLTFLHAALFHKGNQNEDEVSFFVVVQQKQFQKYVEFRNKFDKWLLDRDRDHLEVHIVGGEGFPYARDMLWDDLFLPEELKADIKGSVEGFLAARKIYEQAKVPWKRGVLLYGQVGCGKTSCIRTIISNYDFKPVTVHTSTQTSDDTITEAFEYAQEQEPGLLYIEDLDTLLSSTVSLSHFLNLMDGVHTNNGIMVIATANDLGKLKESITDRPSRFDRKWEIPLPNITMTVKYLKRWFGNTIRRKEYADIAADAVKHNFSYAYLKELYLTSVFNSLAAGRHQPSLTDIKRAKEQLMRDKARAQEGFVPERIEHIGITGTTFKGNVGVE